MTSSSNKDYRYVSLAVSTPTATDTPYGGTQSFSEKEDMMTSRRLLLYSNPPLIEELDNKRLVRLLDAIELEYQTLFNTKGCRACHKFTRLLRPYFNTIPLVLETLYCLRIWEYMLTRRTDAFGLCTMLYNSQKSMKSDRMLIKTLCLMVELFNFSGWDMVADRYFIPALQVASLKTTSLTKIKGRAIDWFRKTFSVLISWDPPDRTTLQTSLLLAEFLIQSRFRHEGALRLEPRKVPFRDLIDAKKLLVFAESRLMNLTVSIRHQALYLVTKFDYEICSANYRLALSTHRQGHDLGNGLFTDCLHSWFPFGEPPLPSMEALH